MTEPKPPKLCWDGDTPRHIGFDDGYTASGDGLAESRHVFLQGNDLAARFEDCKRFTVGELGFGTGLNLAATWRLWAQCAPSGAVLSYVTCEAEPLLPADVLRALGRWSEFAEFAQDIARACQHLTPGFNLRVLAGGRLRLLILVGDAAEQLAQLHARIDAWFLDGFSPAHNPAMWSPAVCQQLARLSGTGATLATFTAAGWVRRNLAAAGFEVGKVPGFGRKRDMSVGHLARSSNNDDALPDWPEAISSDDRPIHIVGAGIAGASTAAALARLGRSVTVWDDGEHAPSHLPALLVRPWPERPRHPLAAFYASAFGCAAHSLQGAPGWHPHGVALLLGKQAKIDAVEDAASLSERTGVAVQAGGLWLEGAGCLEPVPWISSLLDHPRIKHNRSKWKPGICDGLVVMAAGALSTGLLDLPASVTRGQMSRYETTESFAPTSSLAGAGLCTRTSDGIWLGSSFVHDTTSLTPDAAEAETYRGKWQPLLPDVPSAATEHRAALRIAGQGRMPYVGPLRDDGLTWANFGHGSRGATAASLCAEFLAAAVDGHPLPLPQSQIMRLHPQRVTTKV